MQLYIIKAVCESLGPSYMAASPVNPCCPTAASLLEMLIENQFQVVLEMLPDVNDSEETWGSLLLKSLYAFG